MRFRRCSPAAAGFLANLGMDMDVGARRWPDDDFSLLFNLQSFWASRPRDGLKQSQNGQTAPEPVFFSIPSVFVAAGIQLSTGLKNPEQAKQSLREFSFLFAFIIMPTAYGVVSAALDF